MEQTGCQPNQDAQQPGDQAGSKGDQGPHPSHWKQWYTKHWYRLAAYTMGVVGAFLILLALVLGVELPDAVVRHLARLHGPKITVDSLLLVGLLLAGAAGSNFLVYFLVHRLGQRLLAECKLTENYDPRRPTSFLLGLCENTMYPVSLLVGKPEFIGVWLAVKVAGAWILWGSPRCEFDKLVCGREEEERKFLKQELEDAQKKAQRNFSVLLIGSALSIMCSGIVYCLIRVLAIVPDC